MRRERGTNHADDLVWFTSEYKGFAQQAAVASEAATQESVADDDETRSARTVLVRGERTSALGGRAKQVKVICGYVHGRHLLRINAGEIHATCRPIVCRDLLKYLPLVAVRVELRNRRNKVCLARRPGRRGQCELYHPIRF